MKKKLLMLLGIAILATTIGVSAKPDSNSDLTNAIMLYKKGNYSEAYVVLEKALLADPANALAYYYMAMTSAQIGKKDEAVTNYEKVLQLVPYDNNLSRYAIKGKRCIETPDKCERSLYESEEEEFILNKLGPKTSEIVRSEYEKLKIENLKREINRNNDMDPQKFKDYKDFSSMNNSATPSNDEIVAALRTLQKAGLTGYSSMNVDLMGFNDNSQQNLMNMMNTSSMNPHLIQAFLTNNLTQGF